MTEKDTHILWLMNQVQLCDREISRDEDDSSSAYARGKRDGLVLAIAQIEGASPKVIEAGISLGKLMLGKQSS